MLHSRNDKRLGSHKTRELAHFSQFPHSHIHHSTIQHECWRWQIVFSVLFFDRLLHTHTYTQNYAGIRMVCRVKGTSCVVSSKSKKAKVIVPNSQKKSVNVVVVLWLVCVSSTLFCPMPCRFVYWITLQDPFLSCLIVEHVDKKRRKGEMRKNVSWSIGEGDFQKDLSSDTSSVVD